MRRPLPPAGLARLARAALLSLAVAASVAAPRAVAAQDASGWLERARLGRLASFRGPIVVWGELGVVEHRVTLGDEVEQATGPVVALAVEAAPTSWLDLRLAASGGRLDADWTPSEDRRMGELTLAAEAFPLPWIGVVGAVSTRGYRTDFGRQRWTRLVAGPELRTPLYGDHIAGRVRLAAMPYLSVSDTRSPTRALEGEAAVTYENARLRAALAYSLERYDFEAVAGARRLEQLSALRLALGWRLGR